MPYVVSSQLESPFSKVEVEIRQIAKEDFVYNLVLPRDVEDHPKHASIVAVMPKSRMGSTEALNYYIPFELFRHGGLPVVLDVVECSPGLCLPGPELI